MGLSSSQARLLTLTSRMHQIEYKAARLEAMKLQMANESKQVYDEYLDALEATKVQVKTLNSDGSASYKDITSYDDFVNAGFQIQFVDNETACADTDEFTAACATHGITAIPTTNFKEFITNLINSGTVVIIDTKVKEEFKETSVATNTGLQEVADETLLRKAEAKYEADMRKIDAKDRKYDQDLAAIENERNAIKSEMETLKTVAKDNVERTFKLFS